MKTNDFYNWMAGFIDGEGHFAVKLQRNKRGDHYVPEFIIKLRDDDKVILDKLQKETGLGNVSCPPSQINQAKWCVANVPQCLKLIEILDIHPLRAKKKRDYEIWRKIVIAMSENSKTAKSIPQSILDMIVDLKAVRKHGTHGG